jgi:hypothetical protein
MVKKMDMEIFNLKLLNEDEVISIRLQSKTSLQLWKTYMIMETSIGHATQLDGTSTFHPKRVSVFVN